MVIFWNGLPLNRLYATKWWLDKDADWQSVAASYCLLLAWISLSTTCMILPVSFAVNTQQGVKFMHLIWPPKISALCIFIHCIQIRVFKCGCGREGQHLSFLWSYVKHYIVNFGGILLLVRFPSKLIQPIRRSVGGSGADSGDPLSDPQLGSNNSAYQSHPTQGFTAAPLGFW